MRNIFVKEHPFTFLLTLALFWSEERPRLIARGLWLIGGLARLVRRGLLYISVVIFVWSYHNRVNSSEIAYRLFCWRKMKGLQCLFASRSRVRVRSVAFLGCCGNKTISEKSFLSVALETMQILLSVLTPHDDFASVRLSVWMWAW